MRRRVQELDLAFYAGARVDGIEIVRSEAADFDVNLGVRWEDGVDGVELE